MIRNRLGRDQGLLSCLVGPSDTNLLAQVSAQFSEEHRTAAGSLLSLIVAANMKFGK